MLSKVVLIAFSCLKYFCYCAWSYCVRYFLKHFSVSNCSKAQHYCSWNSHTQSKSVHNQKWNKDICFLFANMFLFLDNTIWVERCVKFSWIKKKETFAALFNDLSYSLIWIENQWNACNNPKVITKWNKIFARKSKSCFVWLFVSNSFGRFLLKEKPKKTCKCWASRTDCYYPIILHDALIHFTNHNSVCQIEFIWELKKATWPCNFLWTKAFQNRQRNNLKKSLD